MEEESMGKSELIAQVKRWQSEALVLMVSPATRRDERGFFDGAAAAYGNVLRLVKGEAQ